MTNAEIIEFAQECASTAFDSEPTEMKPADHAYSFVRQFRSEEASDALKPWTERDGNDAYRKEWERLEMDAQDWILFTVVYKHRWEELRNAD